MTVLALGLVCWIVTTILVESELTRPFRQWLSRKENAAANYDPTYLRDYPPTDLVGRARLTFWRKARYLACCHLCAGTWVAIVLVLVAPVSFLGSGVVGILLDALLVKAIGHAALVLHKVGERYAR